VGGLGAASIPSTGSHAEVDRFFHGAAPELIEPQRFRLANTGATAATDVYAFGVLAWEVSGGHVKISERILRRNGTRSLPGEFPFTTGAMLQGFIRW
jgi:hypothetical protein